MKKSYHATTPDIAAARFLTQDELCRRWQTSIMTLWRMRQKGRLPAYKIGSRGVRFALSDIQRIEMDSAA